MFEFEKMKLKMQYNDYIIHRADTRGYFNHGWLKTWHTFSFADYFDPDRVRFGKLRVINDDIIAPGMGFGLHPHQDMEIVTIPLKGALKHTDNTGGEEIIYPGQVQVMSAGKGIWHSEYNASNTEDLSLLQIWIFPEKDCLDPGYKTGTFNFNQLKNNLLCVAGDKNTAGNHLPINQQAYISIGQLDIDQQLDVEIKLQKNGVYIFVIDGDIIVNDIHLQTRDAAGFDHLNHVQLKTSIGSRFIIFEIPM